MGVAHIHARPELTATRPGNFRQRHHQLGSAGAMLGADRDTRVAAEAEARLFHFEMRVHSCQQHRIANTRCKTYT